MSAGLTDRDWMFSANGERPWHGIGTVVTESPTSEEALKLAKLDWDVLQQPVYQVLENRAYQIPDFFANVRSDTNDVLGIVKGRYTIVQNREAFSFVDDIVSNDSDEAVRYETAGSLFGGKKIFLVVRLADRNILGDNIENYLFFTTSHDGSSSLTAGISNVRVVCNNTLQLAIGRAKNNKRVWTCKHTLNIESRKQEAMIDLGLAVEYLKDMNDVAEKMAVKKIAEEEFFKKLYHSLKIADKNKQRVIEDIAQTYNWKHDLQNFRGTAWGLYNAVADYVSNNDSLRTTDKSSENKLNKFFTGYEILDISQKILDEVA